MLENGISGLESKTLPPQNSQQNRNAAKSLSRPTTGSQVSNLGMEDMPVFSTSKKLGNSDAFFWEQTKSVFLTEESMFSFCFHR